MRLMAARTREQELRDIRGLRGKPDTIERMYMGLYDEKVRLEFVVREYERQLAEQDKDVLLYRNKYNEPICPAIGRFAMSDHKVGIMKDKPCIMNAGRKT